MYGCESWTIKKAECQRIDAFELWCWRRLLRVPWTARRSNQSLLKEISPECSLKGLMLKLKLQYLATFWEELTPWKRPWCWERLRAGEGDNRGWDGWMASPTQWRWIGVNSRSWWWTRRPGIMHSMWSQRVGHDWLTELSWTALQWFVGFCHTTAWINYNVSAPSWSFLPSTPLHHHSRSSQSTSLISLCYSSFLQAIYFTHGSI